MISSNHGSTFELLSGIVGLSFELMSSSIARLAGSKYGLTFDPEAVMSAILIK
jgi:hypothetical protein